ncbi:substrate-binding periplasmic protein [Nitratidesulfovibrio sp. SRB-5]|uniref:substrate-binding periplasmic protein n=1 Tax=Nitratidesulfovibrio sp. SRB-5 TaxID=2872636 RepID=UPI00167E76B3|nr:transporter substrate-binding domain-containing protein [Nitratidesulfovibrio sp. SRB-5]MBZ2171320.1 transporter substrate-binding domain-containing protein [Nitratidesulfovibrio sp. SRB-5]
MPAPGQDVSISGGSAVSSESAPASTAPASAINGTAHPGGQRTTPPPARPAKGSGGGSALHIATYDWPPYVEHNLPHGGYVARVIRAALASVGLEARLEFMPWARGMSLLRDGKVTAVAPAYRTAERESECDLSAPFPGGPLALFGLTANTLHWNDLRDLAGLRIGVVRGYAHTQAFDAAAFLRKEPANDELANLRKLLAGRIDAMAADRNVVHFLLRRDLPAQAASLAEFDPILGERDLHVCFSRARPDHAALREAFDRGLATIRASGLLDELHREMRRLTEEQPAGQ